MKLFRQGTLNVVFPLRAAIYAARSRGRATLRKARQGPPSKDPFEQSLPGDTLVPLEGNAKSL